MFYEAFCVIIDAANEILCLQSLAFLFQLPSRPQLLVYVADSWANLRWLQRAEASAQERVHVSSIYIKCRAGTENSCSYRRSTSASLNSQKKILLLPLFAQMLWPILKHIEAISNVFSFFVADWHLFDAHGGGWRRGVSSEA